VLPHDYFAGLTRAALAATLRTFTHGTIVSNVDGTALALAATIMRQTEVESYDNDGVAQAVGAGLTITVNEIVVIPMADKRTANADGAMLGADIQDYEVQSANCDAGQNANLSTGAWTLSIFALEEAVDRPFLGSPRIIQNPVLSDAEKSFGLGLTTDLGLYGAGLTGVIGNNIELFRGGRQVGDLETILTFTLATALNMTDGGIYRPDTGATPPELQGAVLDSVQPGYKLSEIPLGALELRNRTSAWPAGGTVRAFTVAVAPHRTAVVRGRQADAAKLGGFLMYQGITGKRPITSMDANMALLIPLVFAKR
jgi:hypothetical protein